MMDFMLPIDLPKAAKPITHQQKILSVGSCFTEHIGNALKDLKFTVLQNPNGILFDPASVCNSLVAYIRNDHYNQNDLFYLNELWHSWRHHSRFSGMQQHEVLKNINAAQNTAHHFLKEADWLIITLGSSFNYRLTNNAAQFETFSNSYGWSGHLDTTSVANCHRAPANWFSKHLMSVEDIIASLDNTVHQLKRFNPKLQIIFTISPVRHVRDGVVENNRSKARLIEAVHHLVHKFESLYYFPAYELVIDVLRDYRFYDIDMVHPNYPATEFVLQHFLKTHMSAETNLLLEEIKKIMIARRHRAAHAGTEAHKKFLQAYREKTKSLQQQHPFLNLQEEIAYFSGAIGE